MPDNTSNLILSESVGDTIRNHAVRGENGALKLKGHSLSEILKAHGYKKINEENQPQKDRRNNEKGEH